MINEFIISYPRVSIVTIAALITLGMTLVTKYFTDQNRMREMKGRQKELNKKSKEHRGNKEKIAEIQKEIMEISMEMMFKHSFKPLIITMIPIFLIFWWVRGIYAESIIADTWFWWYLGSGITSSIVFRKILNVA